MAFKGSIQQSCLFQIGFCFDEVIEYDDSKASIYSVLTKHQELGLTVQNTGFEIVLNKVFILLVTNVILELLSGLKSGCDTDFSVQKH